MNKKDIEQDVLNTLKNGFGLTEAEQVILDIYIDKLQEENGKLKYEHLEADELIKALQEKNKNMEENNLSYQEELAKAWKENEKLKRKNIELADKLQIAKGGIQIANLDMIDNNFISKDTIKTKIKELEDMKFELTDEQGYWGKLDIEAQIEVLKELLGDDE